MAKQSPNIKVAVQIKFSPFLLIVNLVIFQTVALYLTMGYALLRASKFTFCLLAAHLDADDTPL